MRGLFGEVVGSLEIPAKEPDLAVYILLEKGRSVRARELAMDRNGRGAGNGGHLPGPLAVMHLSLIIKSNPYQRTCTSIRETSSVGGPSRQTATPSRIPCFIS